MQLLFLCVLFTCHVAVVLSDYGNYEVQYTITPAVHPNSAHITLTQLADRLSQDLDKLKNETSISLHLLPGNHTLNKQFSVANIKKFSMKRCGSTSTNEVVFVHCESGRFDFNDISFVLIESIQFTDCRSTTVRQVNQFIIRESLFQSFIGRVFILSRVSTAEIASCLFMSNRFVNESYFQQDNVTTQNHVLKSEHVLRLTLHFTNRSVMYFTSESIISGGVIYAEYSNISISDSKFIRNSAKLGGVLLAVNCSSVHISTSLFRYNHAENGGVFATSLAEMVIEQSSFNNNQVDFDGGVIMSYDGIYIINGSKFISNQAQNQIGVMKSCRSILVVVDSLFSDNSAGSSIGVIFLSDSLLHITGSNFSNNSAQYSVGVLEMCGSSELYIYNCTFVHNTAAVLDSCLRCSGGNVNIYDGIFEYNHANEYELMTAFECFVQVTNTMFQHNLGSIYISDGRLSFHGDNVIRNCSSGQSPNKNEAINYDIFTILSLEAGAITSWNSTVIFNGVSSLIDNTALNGGAILAVASKIVVNGETMIANNTAIGGNGGGVLLQGSTLYVNEKCHLLNNQAATDGGAMYLSDSKVHMLSDDSTLHMTSNCASRGGGMYFDVNSKVYLNYFSSFTFTNATLLFTDNSALYGGAVFVSDYTNSKVCWLGSECFIQIQPYIDVDILKALIFTGNTAMPMKQGSNIFGGFVDECTLIPLLETQFVQFYYGQSALESITSLKSITEFTSDTVSSYPVKLCFCTINGSTSQADCSYQPPTISVRKGQKFTISLVALDQVNHFVDASVHGSLSSLGAGFAEGQQIQSVKSNCTELQFNVFSPRDYEKILLHANGSCMDSILYLNIQFKNCTCPIGLEPCQSTTTACECFCDSRLSPYVTYCNATTGSLVLKQQSKVWIMYYSNELGAPGYIIYSHCPFDYCLSSTRRVTLNFNYRNDSGSNSLCAYNRKGILCGACKQNLSLSLGSSRCLICEVHWPVLLVTIILTAIMSGIFLVIFILVLNITVSVGLINSFIFYANIISSGQTLFFPSSQSSYPKVLVAWLNMDVGIDACFIKGLDTYTKTWLQLVFPVYVISLVIIIIVISEHSRRFTLLIGRKNPVSTLATLILLSYAKLLSTTITILSYAVLHYPDGSTVTVWLLDGNVEYFQGKHAVLCIAALFIILLGIPYTLLLFLWQWLVRAPRWKIFDWTRNTKLNAFVTTYHAPYNSRHRYWTGLLLLVRVILYITASVTMFSSPESLLLITILLIGGLLFFKGVLRMGVYKNVIVDVVETLLYFNLLAFAALSMYDQKPNTVKQTAVAYVSVFTTVILLAGSIVYHIIILIKRKKSNLKTSDQNVNIPSQNQSANSKTTHSVVEIL